MKPKVHLSEWKSAEAEARFRTMATELADELLTEHPEAIDVPTRLGTTRAYRWPGDGEPVLFLHGTAGTSLMWAAFADQRQRRLMYAVDTIGDVGDSHQEVAIEGAEHLAEWLVETMAGLGLERVHVVGMSYGGFLALNLAARRPELVASLFLIDPAGIERVRMVRFMAWGMSLLVASLLPARPRAWAARALRTPILEDPRVLRLSFFAQRNHRSRLLRPEPLTDAQLESIAAPVCVVLGAKSEVFPPDRVQARIDEHVPHASVEHIEGAGHAVVTSHTDLIADRLDRFLDRHSPSPTA
ncbi:MAG: alpha/beta fold hydrolase [Acidimicrobiales bacterium]